MGFDTIEINLVCFFKKMFLLTNIFWKKIPLPKFFFDIRANLSSTGAGAGIATGTELGNKLGLSCAKFRVVALGLKIGVEIWE